MTARQQPSLRLFSLNVNGLRAANKRRFLFNLLHRDTWDDVFLQETHHGSSEEGTERAQGGPHGLRPDWTGPSFWSHGTNTSYGVAIFIRPHAQVSEIAPQYVSADGRTLMVDFDFSGTPFTVVSLYASCVAAACALHFTHSLLPHLPEDRKLLLGEDFNCIAGQLDLLDPLGAPGGRFTGSHDGIRHVEAERQLLCA
jgi:exonuclease III